MSKKGVRPSRCPYCGRKCDGAACKQHRSLLHADPHLYWKARVSEYTLPVRGLSGPYGRKRKPEQSG